MVAGLFAGELSDGEAALRVYLAAGGLALAGLLLLVLTVRWWRGTRPEPEVLAPLEVMSERRWAKAPHPDRQRLLERYRRTGGDRPDPVVVPPPVDLSELARVDAVSFDDLREDRDLGEARVVGPLVVGGTVIPPVVAATSDDEPADEVAADEVAAAVDADQASEAELVIDDDADDEVEIEVEGEVEAHSDGDEPAAEPVAVVDEVDHDEQVVGAFDETVMAVRPVVPGDDTDGIVQQALLIGDGGTMAEPGPSVD